MATTHQQDNDNVYEQDDEDDENDDEFGLEEMGFLFEGSRASTLKHLEWIVPSSNDNDDNRNLEPRQQEVVRVALQVVDDTPGAVISGHYLWPAAPALAQHLVNHYSKERGDRESPSSLQLSPVRSVLELGAGCALASLVALQVFSKSLQCVVITDHDPGTLKRAQDNYELTLENRQHHSSSNESSNCIASIPVLCETLSWGDADACQTLLSKMKREYFHNTATHQTDVNHDDDTPNAADAAFDLLLGSDLIYCLDVIKPLFETASILMIPGGRFWLSQSFPFDDDSEREIDAMCEQFGLTRTIVSDTLLRQATSSVAAGNEEDGVRIQEFVKRR